MWQKWVSVSYRAVLAFSVSFHLSVSAGQANTSNRLSMWTFIAAIYFDLLIRVVSVTLFDCSIVLFLFVVFSGEILHVSIFFLIKYNFFTLNLCWLESKLPISLIKTQSIMTIIYCSSMVPFFFLSIISYLFQEME